jgi:hypothetical protein
VTLVTEDKNDPMNQLVFTAIFFNFIVLLAAQGGGQSLSDTGRCSGDYTSEGVNVIICKYFRQKILFYVSSKYSD